MPFDFFSLSSRIFFVNTFLKLFFVSICFIGEDKINFSTIKINCQHFLIFLSFILYLFFINNKIKNCRNYTPTVLLISIFIKLYIKYKYLTYSKNIATIVVTTNPTMIGIKLRFANSIGLSPQIAAAATTDQGTKHPPPTHIAAI